MSDQSTPHATPTVQIREIGLPEQAAVGKVLAAAGVAAGLTAGAIALLTSKKEEIPTTRTESARQYLHAALEDAQKSDLAKAARKRSKKAEKTVRKQSRRMSKDADKLMQQSLKKATGSADAVRHEVASVLDSFKSGQVDVSSFVEGFAESPLMARLREFGDEARVIAEQGKMKTAEAAHKAQSDVLPQAKETAAHMTKVGKGRVAGVSEKARSEFIPTAQQHAADASAHAKEVVSQVSVDAEKKLADAAQAAEEKRKQATAAVQRGGRETRSLLIWLALAGVLIFSVFLDDEQQEKVKNVALEIVGEARDMYTDMKGNA